MDNKKSLIALALVALVGIIGGTYAYFTSTATLNNSFKAGTYATSVKEQFVSPDNWTPGTTTTKKVNVTNNGTVDIAARATYKEKWTAANGNTLSLTRAGEKVAQFTIGSEWEEAIDGWYYYKDILSNGETSTDFLNSVTFNPNFKLQEDVDINCETTKVDGKTTVNCENLTSGYAGATYTLEITIETVQADQKWDYTAGHTYKIGEVVKVEEEVFNVISDNGDTVTMLAAYNLGTNYRQNMIENRGMFSMAAGWEQGTDIDIQLYDGTAKTYVNEYVSYLRTETSDMTLGGTLITISQLERLGCDVSVSFTCESSINIDWISNGQGWWTSSSHSDPDSNWDVWYIDSLGKLSKTNFTYSLGIRPVITISKSTLANL